MAQSSSGGPARIAHSKGSGPPCESYLQMRTLAEIESLLGAIRFLDSKAEVESFREQLKTTMQPVRQLLTQSRNAKGDLDKRRKVYKERDEE